MCNCKLVLRQSGGKGAGDTLSYNADLERRIVAFLADHGPVGTTADANADHLVMRGCRYKGGLLNFRRHLRRAMRKGLIHGDLETHLAVGPAPQAVPAPEVPSAAMKHRGVLPQPQEAEDLAVARAVEPDRTVPKPELFADLARLVRAMLDCDELHDWAGPRMTLAEVIELAATASTSEPPGSTGALKAQPARSAVTALWVRGFEPGEIATLVAQPLDRVASTLGNHLAKNANPHERTIVSLYGDGVGAVDIARRCGVSRQAVYNTLDRAGITVPSRKLTPTKVKEEIVRLRNEGASFEQIRQATEADLVAIKNTLRAAASKGLLANYRSQTRRK